VLITRPSPSSIHSCSVSASASRASMSGYAQFCSTTKTSWRTVRYEERPRRELVEMRLVDLGHALSSVTAACGSTTAVHASNGERPWG